MQEEKEVKIYIETTLAGPCVKDGWYAAIIDYQTCLLYTSPSPRD